MAVRRVLIVMDDDSEAQLLVCDHTQDCDNNYLSSQIIEVVMGRGARFDLYDMEESSAKTARYSQLFARQEAGSSLLVNGITLTGGVTRNDYNIDVTGEHSETLLAGMAIGTGHQHTDNNSSVNHLAERCHSRQLFKYVLDEESTGAFEGGITVNPSARFIEAYQSNKNLLASTSARMHTKPQLLIYCDDVKCSHGATTGQLDAEALFYMRSRGISEKEARTMLMQAFMADVIDTVRMDGRSAAVVRRHVTNPTMQNPQLMNQLDVAALRRDFPVLDRTIYGKPLIYLDNTATSQTPSCVVDTIRDIYFHTKANVHRGVHTMSQEMTAMQEATRERVRQMLNAESTSEIIFTRGTTEAINLVASSMGDSFVDGDEVIVTVMEHHANIVPWQLLSRNKRVTLRVVPMDERGVLDLEAYRSLFNSHTRMVAVTHVSNVLGTVNPVKEMIAEAHRHGVPVLVDGAQAVAHMSVDVRDLDCDFYVFSSHKMYGPTGVGVLYGKRSLLEMMPPYQGGGEMIANVTFEHTTFAELPFKFEAGTPDFVGIAALHTAIEYMQGIGIDAIAAHEHDLLQYTTERMADIPGMRIFGTAPGKSAVISFLIGDAHHYDTGLLLDKLGIAVRTGHHCAQPLMHALGIEGTVRASFALYNTREEADAFIAALKRVAAMLQ